MNVFHGLIKQKKGIEKKEKREKKEEEKSEIFFALCWINRGIKYKGKHEGKNN